MTTEKKPREFWISSSSQWKNISNTIPIYTAVATPPQNPGWIKVIEFDAFDFERTRANTEAKRADDLEAQLSSLKTEYKDEVTSLEENLDQLHRMRREEQLARQDAQDKLKIAVEALVSAILNEKVMAQQIADHQSVEHRDALKEISFSEAYKYILRHEDALAKIRGER